MFPIRDHNPSGRVPFVTYALIALNVVIFLANLPIQQDNAALWQLYQSYALIPAKLSMGEGYSGIITSMFLHGGWMHLFGNMLFLWIYGDNIEDELGPAKFLGFYLLAGIAAGLAQYITAPNSQVPMVGASGAIAGVMGAYLLLFPKARVDILIFLIVYVRVLPIPAFIVLAMWFAMQFFGGVGADPDQGGVAYWAYAGGFIACFALIFPLWLAKGGPDFWARTEGHPPHPEARYRMVESSIPKVRRK